MTSTSEQHDSKQPISWRIGSLLTASKARSACAMQRKIQAKREFAYMHYTHACKAHIFVEKGCGYILRSLLMKQILALIEEKMENEVLSIG